MSSLRQTPLTCSGHTRPVVQLAFSDITPFGYFLISACKGKFDWLPFRQSIFIILLFCTAKHILDVGLSFNVYLDKKKL